MSVPPRLWIVDPSMRYPEDQGCAEIVRGWSGDHRILRPALAPGDGPEPETGYACDGVALLGSAASVHDSLPWLEPLTAWLRPILDGEVRLPLLGVCFGHQLIGHMAGARVGFVRQDESKVVAVEESRVEGSRLIPEPTTLRVVVSHREEVRECPRRYRIVARRAGIPVDGIEHETLPIFSFQFHPEAREEFATRAGLPVGLIDARVREDSQRVLAAFRRAVRTGAPTSS